MHCAIHSDETEAENKKGERFTKLGPGSCNGKIRLDTIIPVLKV